ncbi:hypothetical protein D9611_001405 [Ephemerocybe angulata]|uniref:Uncharacterized protein n=1 Tax=Ephemerocybe angulata TaxID=980116 RepID=A0A8H5CIX6_9AGAR|nr:hypothetical protein D9611_001405 [Tulosesus angulatus]
MAQRLTLLYFAFTRDLRSRPQRQLPPAPASSQEKRWTANAYEEARDILREESRDIVMADILGTRKGIKALAKFLKESGAFTRDGRAPNKRAAPRWEDEREPGVEGDDESDEYG